MSFDLLDLPWLPEAGSDFKQRCRTLSADTVNAGLELINLATARLKSSQAVEFARTLKRLSAEATTLDPLTPLRLAILPSFTTDTLADHLPAACARHGIAVEIGIAPVDQIAQTALDADAEVFRHRPDAVLLLFDHRWLGLDRFGARAEDAIDRVAACVGALRGQIGAQVIVPTAAVPPGSLFGSLDRGVAGSVRAAVEEFNRKLVEFASTQGVILFDVAALAEQVGTSRWFDPVAWNLYKIPMAASCSAMFAEWLGRLLGALRGHSRKCLVLDCDNTLWGGVIGDDGMEHIVVGSGSGLGESFLSVQQLALDLKARGVLLAVSSKNDDAVARRPFADHPDMLLRETDLALFQANWTDKPTNLQAIARELRIGVDSLVLLDDNPAERAQVRAALPMVAVPELPADPAYFALTLASAGYFEALSFSDEDRNRAETYTAEAKRAELRHELKDLGDYLAALDMEISLRPFDAVGRQRIAQLINKSNQFNLTTRRYTEADVARLEANNDLFTLQVRLRDKYSDYGMIGVCIAGPSGADSQAWDVDSWLMSCRVLGRKVEQAMLQALVEAAREAGKTEIYARYLRTPKNHMVAELLDSLGFERLGETPDGNRSYRLEVSAFQAEALPHTIVAG